MKHTFTILTFVCALLCIPSIAHANKLYIIPADASGNIVRNADGDYPDKQALTESADEVYTINAVDLPSGKFAIYAYADDTQESTFYATASWAVSPIPPSYPSPLILAVTGSLITLAESGTYDIEFYSRNMEGISSHMLIATPTTPDMAHYPSQIYLVGENNDVVTLTGNPHEGIYYALVTPPATFKISYEPRVSEDAFIFGPAGGGNGNVPLNANESVAIAYATGTNATFTVQPSAIKAHTSHIVVNLAAGYILATTEIPTGIDKVITDGDKSMYYTLAGVPLRGEPDSSGVYLRVQGGSISKILIP